MCVVYHEEASEGSWRGTGGGLGRYQASAEQPKAPSFNWHNSKVTNDPSERHGQIAQYCYFKISITIISTREASSDRNLKVTLLAYQNNYVGIPSTMSNVAKGFEHSSNQIGVLWERDNWYQEYRYPIKFKHSFYIYIGERNSWPQGKPVGRGQRGDKEREEKEEVEEMDEWARETRNEVKIDSAENIAPLLRCVFGKSGCFFKFYDGVTSGTIDTRREAKEIKRQGENTKTSGRRPERKTRPAIKSHQKFHFAITDAKSKQNHGRFVNYIFHGYFLLLNIIFVRKWGIMIIVLVPSRFVKICVTILATRACTINANRIVKR
ncbi:hypothetical protein ALC57_16296 [Trachymyrmex cornetzi]|uniref:Uncharacterized protein n=1 Tax=Trachymyrmex cornetzi TaxID=471704 RepID=A0A195DF38_9HYME|nr:hypothetical protein ALC57_16296 [Trachymyrmex cornetzi]